MKSTTKTDGRTKELPEIRVTSVNKPSEQAIKNSAEFLAKIAKEHYEHVKEAKQWVYLCNRCDEMFEDETSVCELCESESVRKVHKDDMDM